MATSCLEHNCETPYFDGTNYALWKLGMSTYFHAMSPKIWWIVDVGFSHALDDNAPTNAQGKCVHLDAQATNALFSALSVDVFYKVCNLKSAHECGLNFKEYMKNPIQQVLIASEIQ